MSNPLPLPVCVVHVQTAFGASLVGPLLWDVQRLCRLHISPWVILLYLFEYVRSCRGEDAHSTLSGPNAKKLMDELRKSNPNATTVDTIAMSVYSYGVDTKKWINILDALIEKFDSIQPAEIESLFWKFLHMEIKGFPDAALALTALRSAPSPEQTSASALTR